MCVVWKRLCRNVDLPMINWTSQRWKRWWLVSVSSLKYPPFCTRNKKTIHKRSLTDCCILIPSCKKLSRYWREDTDSGHTWVGAVYYICIRCELTPQPKFEFSHILCLGLWDPTATNIFAMERGYFSTDLFLIVSIPDYRILSRMRSENTRGKGIE